MGGKGWEEDEEDSHLAEPIRFCTAINIASHKQSSLSETHVTLLFFKKKLLQHGFKINVEGLRIYLRAPLKKKILGTPLESCNQTYV